MISNVKTIKYTKANGDVSTRKVIMRDATVPPELASIDLSQIDEATAVTIINAHREYEEYVQMKMKQILSFTDWVETSQLPIKNEDIHWRIFEANRTEILN